MKTAERYTRRKRRATQESSIPCRPVHLTGCFENGEKVQNWESDDKSCLHFLVVAKVLSLARSLCLSLGLPLSLLPSLSFLCPPLPLSLSLSLSVAWFLALAFHFFALLRYFFFGFYILLATCIRRQLVQLPRPLSPPPVRPFLPLAVEL